MTENEFNAVKKVLLIEVEDVNRFFNEGNVKQNEGFLKAVKVWTDMLREGGHTVDVKIEEYSTTKCKKISCVTIDNIEYKGITD